MARGVGGTTPRCYSYRLRRGEAHAQTQAGALQTNTDEGT